MMVRFKQLFLNHLYFHDPNAPKRGKSAYMFWLADNRPRLTKPGMSVVDVTKAAGEEWKTVSAQEKAKYEKMAAEDKKRYEKVCFQL